MKESLKAKPSTINCNYVYVFEILYLKKENHVLVYMFNNTVHRAFISDVLVLHYHLP